MIRHFLSLSDAGADGIAAILADALDRKAARGGLPKGAPDTDAPLAGHTLAMVFEKSSTRTRVSFDIAMRQLGGSALVLDSGTTQLGRGETVADTARILSGYCDAIMLRTDEHAKLLEMAEFASVPVVNGLTDVSHPCQIMADLMTLLEAGRALPGLKVAWLGDGNNVLYSLMEAATILRFDVVAACPADYELDVSAQMELRALKLGLAGDMRRIGNRWRELPTNSFTRDPFDAVAGADVVVTDTWISMGQEEAATKLAALAPYQVTPALMAAAKPGAAFLHCLPAHRGEEVAAKVIDGPQSLIWPEAENRLHVQKSILRWCFGQVG